MLNKKKIAIAATGIVIMICGVIVYVSFINKEPTYNYIPRQDTVISEQQQIQNDYDEILKGLEVDVESSIIVNPTIDEDTGAMSGENSKGEFIQTPPIEIPESEEDQLRILLEVAGVPEETIEETVKEEYPVEQTNPAETKPVQPSKPVENKPAEQNNNQKPWEGKSPLSNSDPGQGTHIKPGEGSGETDDTTIFK